MSKLPKNSTPSRTTASKFLFTNQRGRLAAFIILAVLAAAITAISNSSAESKMAGRKEQKNRDENAASTAAFTGQPGPRLSPRQANAQEQDSSDAGQQLQTVPVLTMQNAPDIPQCREVMKQEILDLVNSSTEDPGVIFENNRRAHPHMFMMPPPLDCASQLWKAARRGGAAVPEADASLLSLRQYPLDSVFNLAALSASVGTNIDPSNGVEGYQGENSISIDPNNPLHIIAHSNTFFRDTTPQCQSPTGGTASTFGTMALFGSTDGGATWTYNCAPWHTSVTGGVASANAWFGSDPALAWDSQGRAYACYMLISQNASGSAGASIVVARSTDNGASWQQFGSPVVNRITSTTSLDDKEMFTIDNTTGQAHSFPGRMYVIWDEGNAERIAHSDDGVTWTTVTPASNTGAIGGNVVIGADGTVYAIWTRYNVETIVFSKSTDGGTTWTTPAVIATLALQSFGSNNLPPAQDKRGINGFGSIDVDRNPNSAFFGNLYVSFPDFPSGTTSGADINTYVIRSTNGGTNWSSRVQVNDDSFGATQFFPWLAVDQSDGTVNVSWVDSRLDPVNRKTQMVYARSSDGGASFEPNILVTDGGVNWRNNANYADENSTDNASYNGNQYGDYSGIAAFNRQVHPLWTDSREFFPVADTQSPTRREDNGTAVIINCSVPSAIGAPTVNSSTTPSVSVTWSAPAGWGTNATNGTYSVYRNTSPVFPNGSPLASGLTSTSYVDTTGVNGTTYYYFVRAKNNCPGTALTPMSTDAPASAGVVFGTSSGTPTGTLQGTVTSGGNPLSGVVVTAGAYSATTNGSGFYQIPAINAGTYTVSASPAGYNATSVNGVVVTDGGTTVQDLSLTPITSNSCFTDTSFGDFSTGSGTNADIAASPGDVKLTNSGGEAIDQNQASATTINTTPTSTTWAGQTFTAGKTGNLTKISVGLGLNSGSTGTVTVEIHNASTNTPGSTVLSSVATLGPVTNASGTVATYTATFSTPAAVVSGTQYSIVIKGSTGSVYVVTGSSNPYSGGRYLSTTNSGSSWTAQTTADMTFTTYVTTPVTYQASGNFISSVKDSGAVVGSTPTWGTISWTNAALPSGTNIQFQAAGANSASGPFNFVGPDSTSGTFFTNGASLAQFNGFRYLKYKAILTTSNTSNTPTLNDVTVCFSNTVPTVSISGQVTDGTNAIGGVTMTLSGSQSGTTSTDGSGNFSFSGLPSGGNYTVTPSKTNYVFYPVNRIYNGLGSSQLGANFVGRLVRRAANFDGDSKSDIATWNPDTGNWNVLNSSTNAVVTSLWGSGSLGDKLVPGDYDGDGKADLAVWRPSEGNWYVVSSITGLASAKGWGTTGDIPVAGDYDGDGKTDYAVFRPSEGNWYIINSATNTTTVKGWGASTDVPVPGDYDGDGKTDIAVYRPSEGNWYIINSATNTLKLQGWGASTDRPVQGDYDGDGRTDIAVFRPSEGNWYIINSTGGTTIKGWGAGSDTAVPGDYDGDGKTDIAVFRPSEGNWYILNSSTNTMSVIYFGSGSDLPVEAAYITTLP